jgi:hypothetical protein
MDSKHKKTRVVISIELIIAFFFLVGAHWLGNDFHLIFHSYFADIALPFGFYFLLFLINGSNNKCFNHWWKKAITIFALTSVSETLQYFGIYALATVFDPIDYVMYAAGVMLAAIVDRKILIRLFSFWDEK